MEDVSGVNFFADVVEGGVVAVGDDGLGQVKKQSEGVIANRDDTCVDDGKEGVYTGGIFRRD